MAFQNEQQAREAIKEQVRAYYHQFKEPRKPFEPGDRIAYASRVYDEKEMCALTDAMLDFWLTAGRFSEQFEREFAEYLGIPQALIILGEVGLLNLKDLLARI